MKKLMNMKTVAAVVAAAATISLSACGGGSSDGGGGGGGDAPKLDADQQAVADTLATSIVDDTTNVVDNQTDAKCWADGVVAGIGVDRLKEMGITADSANLSSFAASDESEASVVTDSLYKCVDVKAAMTTQLEAQQGVTPEAAKCVVDKIDDNAIKEIINASILGKAPSGDALENFVQAGVDCGGG